MVAEVGAVVVLGVADIGFILLLEEVGFGEVSALELEGAEGEAVDEEVFEWADGVEVLEEGGEEGLEVCAFVFGDDGFGEGGAEGVGGGVEAGGGFAGGGAWAGGKLGVAAVGGEFGFGEHLLAPF